MPTADFGPERVRRRADFNVPEPGEIGGERERGVASADSGAGHHLAHIDTVDGHPFGRHRFDHLTCAIGGVLGLPNRHR